MKTDRGLLHCDLCHDARHNRIIYEYMHRNSSLSEKSRGSCAGGCMYVCVCNVITNSSLL